MTSEDFERMERQVLRALAQPFAAEVPATHSFAAANRASAERLQRAIAPPSIARPLPSQIERPEVMSADLYPNRLYWDGRQGCAKFGGQGVQLSGMPLVDGLPPWTTEVDYAPGVVAELRERCDAKRDMTPHEIRAVRAWLAWRCWDERDTRC